MASIKVKRLVTSNTVPTITGTATFDRYDLDGNPKEAIEIILNYRPYYMFEGNLGIKETSVKGTYDWSLHIDSPLYPGTYDVEANVYRVADDLIIASDDTVNEITITQPTVTQIAAQNKSLRQKAATVNMLMAALNGIFGNSGVGGPSPSVHPTQDDQSSSSLAARGAEEREEDPRVKSKDKVVDNAPLPPVKHNFDSTDAAAAPASGMDWELSTLDNARSETGDAAQMQDDTKNIMDEQNKIQGTGEFAVGSAFG